MSDFRVVAQPEVSTVSDVVQSALMDNRYNTLRAAVAYITSSGVQELEHALLATNLDKKWMTGADRSRQPFRRSTSRRHPRLRSMMASE